MEGRPDQDTYFMRMAQLARTRSNCYRRAVGCILVDGMNRVLATGYNGVPRNVPHCEIGKCPREHHESGTNLGICRAIHAEQNALIQCTDPDRIFKAYITHSPCLICTVMLMNTACYEIVFEEFYPNSESAREEWINAGRKWTQIPRSNTDV